VKLVRRLSVLVLGVSALLLSGARDLPGPRGRGFEGERGEADPKALAALLERAATWPALPEAAARGPLDVQVSTDFLVTPDETGFQVETQTEPFVAANPEREGHLVVGYQEGRFFDGGARALGFAVSTDGGRRWRRGLLPGLTTLNGGSFPRASDPWVAFGNGGRVYYASLVVDGGVLGNAPPRSEIVVSSSGDGGETWGHPVTVYRANNEFSDKEVVVVDTRDDSPYKGRVYVGWVNLGPAGSFNLVMAHSTDDGQSFSRPFAIRSDGVNIGVMPVVGPGGVVHAVWEHAKRLGPNRYTDFQIVSARSEDGGQTWSEAVTIDSLGTYEVPDLRTGEGLPSLAVDPRNGNLYVAWADDDFSPGVSQVVFSRSTDGGRTWSPRRLVSGGPTKAASFTPAVAVNGKGQVGVAFYSLRNDRSRRYLADEFIVFSDDEGRTLGPARRVSRTTFDTRFAAVTFSGFFLGDYQGLAAGRQTFHPVWVGTPRTSQVDPPARQSDVFTRAVRP
jgi:hypothetical protein